MSYNTLPRYDYEDKFPTWPLKIKSSIVLYMQIHANEETASSPPTEGQRWPMLKK